MAIAGVMVVAALFYMSEEGEGIRITVRLPIMPPPRIEAISPPEATASPAETRIEHHADHQWFALNRSRL
jgi:hypothetical protein